MKKLSKKDILHIAKLSNISLSPKEIEKFTPQLSKIVDFVGELSNLKTDKVTPTTHTTNLKNVFRKDHVKKKAILPQPSALSQTKKTKNGYFKVPAVLDKKT